MLGFVACLLDVGGTVCEFWEKAAHGCRVNTKDQQRRHAVGANKPGGGKCFIMKLKKARIEHLSHRYDRSNPTRMH
jgi:hypothetical protein